MSKLKERKYGFECYDKYYEHVITKEKEVMENCKVEIMWDNPVQIQPIQPTHHMPYQSGMIIITIIVTVMMMKTTVIIMVVIITLLYYDYKMMMVMIRCLHWL